MSKNTNNQGFSLIEMLVVIATITILLSILMPALGKVRMTAMRLKCASNLRQIDLAIQLYTGDYDNFYPCAEDPLPEGYWLWMGRGWRSFVSPYLGGNIDANNPSVLFCPEDIVSEEKYESTSYSYSMSFYHSPDQIDATSSISDTYQNARPCVPQRVANVRRPSEKIIIGEWLSNHEPIEDDNGWWCWEGSRNYLFVDGRITVLEAIQINSARDGYPDANLTVRGIRGVDLRSE